MHARAHAIAGRRACPRWVALAWLAAGILTLVTIGACRRGVPAIDTAPRPSESGGTISGTVRGPEGSSLVDGRTVEVINVDTGERRHGATNDAGGFSFTLQPGKYRVELALRTGESLVRQPGIIDLNRSLGDAHADFVLRTVRVSRPRGPAYRIDDGLGSPIA